MLDLLKNRLLALLRLLLWVIVAHWASVALATRHLEVMVEGHGLFVVPLHVAVPDLFLPLITQLSLVGFPGEF